MTSVTDETGAASDRKSLFGWWDALKDALDKPLASYYILLGTTALLLTIGLIMVLSASSVFAYTTTGDSYAIIKRQVIWVALAIPLAFIASRLPIKLLRRLAWPTYAISLVLLVATALVGVSINGNQNWLALGPIQIQPSEIAKFALILWSADIYSRKDRTLGKVSHILIPVVPGILLATGLVVVGHDLGTAVIFFIIGLGLLWVVGAPSKLFLVAILVGAVAILLFIATDPERLSRVTSFLDPFRVYHDSGWQPAHGLYALSTGGWFGQGIGASQQKWGDLPEAHTDFIFAVLGEELGFVGTALVPSSSPSAAAT